LTWPVDYGQLLSEWVTLRSDCAHLPPEDRVMLVNDWWFRAPIVNKSISWQDYPNWPDPWQLLQQDGWCDLARALGIVYTLLLLDTNSGDSISLVNTNLGNLVLAGHGKYILNWAPGNLLNIESTPITIQRQLCGDLFLAFTE